MHIFWARLASFCHLGFISDPLTVSTFHNETHDHKGQENKIYTMVKGREAFYRRHTVPVIDEMLHWLILLGPVRWMAENGFAPPLGNFADISYHVEN